MILEDEDALVCDLAETYHIYNYRAMPPLFIATLAAGLRYDSRIIRKMAGESIEEERLTLFGILDCLRLLVWMNSEDGRHNRRRPESIVQSILNKDRKQIAKDRQRVFDSPEDFEKFRAEFFERNKNKHTEVIAGG